MSAVDHLRNCYRLDAFDAEFEAVFGLLRSAEGDPGPCTTRMEQPAYRPRLSNFHRSRLGLPAATSTVTFARSKSCDGSRVPVAMAAWLEEITLPLGPSRTTAGSRIWSARRKMPSSFASGRSPPRICVPWAVGAGTHSLMMLELIPPKST